VRLEACEAPVTFADPVLARPSALGVTGVGGGAVGHATAGAGVVGGVWAERVSGEELAELRRHFVRAMYLLPSKVHEDGGCLVVLLDDRNRLLRKHVRRVCVVFAVSRRKVPPQIDAAKTRRLAL
jgi:hypothetical protein